jgi:hypothetical protein
MTIKPGEDWGELVTPTDALVDVPSDAVLADHIASGDPRPPRVRGGDLLATLGAPPPGPSLRRLPIDVLRVTADDRELVAVAHVVARRSWWRGPVLAIMNVDRLGRWDVAPRAHPNDGRADVVEVDAAMSLRARWEARRRLPSGTHVPHPQITTSRIRDASWTFEPARRVWVDGVATGPVRSLRVVVDPDAAVVHC